MTILKKEKSSVGIGFYQPVQGLMRRFVFSRHILLLLAEVDTPLFCLFGVFCYFLLRLTDTMGFPRDWRFGSLFSLVWYSRS